MTEEQAARLDPAPDGGPPLNLTAAELDAVRYDHHIGPVRMLGIRVRLRVADQRLAAFLRAFLMAFAPCDRATTNLDIFRVGDRWVVYIDGVRTTAVDSVERVARSLVWHLNRLAVNAPTEDVLVHAGVAARGDLAVILPGESGAGKTTLVAALARAGWTYLSDEVAALDGRRQMLHPYPRPLALEPGSWEMIPPRRTDWPDGVPMLVRDLRLVTLGETGAPVPVDARPAAVIFPEVAPGEPTTLEPLSAAETLERLVGLSFNLRQRGRTGFRHLVELVRSTPSWRLRLDGVKTAPALLETLLTSDDAGS